MDEEFVWKVFTQLVMALKECHRHKDATGKVAPILHRGASLRRPEAGGRCWAVRCCGSPSDTRWTIIPSA